MAAAMELRPAHRHLDGLSDLPDPSDFVRSVAQLCSGPGPRPRGDGAWVVAAPRHGLRRGNRDGLRPSHARVHGLRSGLLVALGEFHGAGVRVLMRRVLGVWGVEPGTVLPDLVDKRVVCCALPDSAHLWRAEAAGHPRAGLGHAAAVVVEGVWLESINAVRNQSSQRDRQYHL